MTSDYPYQFEATVQEHDFGKMSFTVVYLPKSLERKLPLKQHPRLRIEGEINQMRFEGAFQPTKERWFLMVSKRLLKICGSALGKKVTIEFDIADQDAVTIPDELRFALDANDDAAHKWNQLTPGKRRGFAYRVSMAKLPETRERRVEEIIDFLLS